MLWIDLVTSQGFGAAEGRRDCGGIGRGKGFWVLGGKVAVGYLILDGGWDEGVRRGGRVVGM